MKTLKKFLNKVIEKSLVLRKSARLVRYVAGKIKYAICTFSVKTEENCVVFASFNGKSFCDSPKAIYNYLKESNEDLCFIWAFSEPQRYEFLKDERTEVVKFGSKQFFEYLKMSKYWVFNSMIYDFVKPNEEQVYVQCWHGTPLKKIGCDLKYTDNAMNSISEVHKKYRNDAQKFKYLIAPSDFAAEKFKTCWDLKALNREDAVVTTGYPRNDFLKKFTSKDILEIKKKLNIDLDKKVVLYAPTWRDNEHNEKGYSFSLPIDFDELQKSLSDEYVVLFRAHYLVASVFDFEKYRGFVYNVSDYDDISELYIVSDLLVTDYSSVFFDYANLKRPVLFYMYDLEKYRDEIRGFYIGLEELPGKIIEDEKSLCREINNSLENFEYSEKYRLFNEKFNSLDDGNASCRVAEIMLEG